MYGYLNTIGGIRVHFVCSPCFLINKETKMVIERDCGYFDKIALEVKTVGFNTRINIHGVWENISGYLHNERIKFTDLYIFDVDSTNNKVRFAYY